MKDKQTTSRKLRVYVGGIPTTTKETELYEYFGSFGPGIVNIQLTRKQEADSNPSTAKPTVKGFCIVELDNASTYRRILSKSIHIFKNREILCQTFRTGSALKKQNRDKNLKRVIIKKVPLEVSIEELKQILEEQGGPIQVLFKFKKDEQASCSQVDQNRKTWFASYSAMFSSIQDAEKVLQLGTLYTYSGRYFKVEAYVPQWNNTSKKLECEPYRPQGIQQKKQSLLATGRKTYQLEKQQTHQDNEWFDKQLSYLKAHQINQEVLSDSSSIFKFKKTDEELYTMDHPRKPTSRKYHATRSAVG